jgi:polar amino acid transport system permease protein
LNPIRLDLQLVSRLAPQLAEGLQLTLLVAAVSAIGALVWGLALAWPRLSRRRLVSGPVIAYIELVRNSPLLVQMYLLYFALPVVGVFIPAFWCGVLAIVAQHGAFFCETYRGGIQSIPAGQWEAGRSIGLRGLKLFRLVVLPQTVLKVAPALTNQLVVLVKDTSLVSAIGVMELTLMAKLSIERSAATFEVFLVIGILYLALTTLVGLAGRLAESRMRARIGRV